MKKTLIIVLCTLAGVAQATNRYVATTGSDTNDGLSWTNAMATVTAAINASTAGDTIKIAQGVYNQSFKTKNGISIKGSYNITTGAQDVELYSTIIDGTGLNKQPAAIGSCTQETILSSLIIQNGNHKLAGGGASLSTNGIIENCIIRNNTTTNIAGGVSNTGGVIRNCTIELNYAGGASGAVHMGKNSVMENCIIRGNMGKYAASRVYQDAVIRNCVFYNNEPSTTEWPNSGGVYNSEEVYRGVVYNCTFANNYGVYAGSHSEGPLYNCAFWGNKAEDGASDPSTFVSSECNESTHNAADDFFDAPLAQQLDAANEGVNGPHFVAPTHFVGAPKNAGQIAAMRAADWSITASSALINKGRSNGAATYDINGVARPKGTGIDIGAYEYDPNAPVVAVTGVKINVDTLKVQEDEMGGLSAIFTPKNATNKNVTWWIEDQTIATIDNYGGVTPVKVGQTRAAVETADGGFTDTVIVVVTEKPKVIIHPEVLAADSLYPMKNHTIPSFIPFWAAKEAARKDSSEENLQAMREKITKLVGAEEPYCLIANIHGDPKTRMAFNWFTNDSITEGKVQLVAKAGATAADFDGEDVITLQARDSLTKALRYAVNTSGLIKAIGFDAKTAFTYRIHRVIAEGLTPGTTYCYRVGYAGHWSDIATFQTAEEEQGEFSFLYMSDSHIMNQVYVDKAEMCAKAAVKNEPDAKFCVFPGDFVETGDHGNSEWEWEQWFETSMRKALYQMPFVVTDGNHDDSDNRNYNLHFYTDNAFNQRSLVLRPQFQGITYSFVYGDVLFLVFSMQDYWRGTYSYANETCAYLTTDVGAWFREQVSAHPECKYRVSLCHKNIFSGSGHQSDKETPMFRTTMLPVFADCEIDLALQGHDHCYEVMGPVDPWQRAPIMGAIADTIRESKGGSTKNMTGLSGGTFTVDDGTLYFIGATCGEKRYDPYTRYAMDAQKDITKMENYYDLFTSKFGQPGVPCYTRVNVKSDGLYLDTYTTDAAGNKTLYNSIKVVRTKEHGMPSGYEAVREQEKPETGKYMHRGELLIVRDGVVYNALGMRK